jgi:hypothetical protein
MIRNFITLKFRSLIPVKGNKQQLQVSPDIIRMIKLRRMKWADHVACLGKQKCI